MATVICAGWGGGPREIVGGGELEMDGGYWLPLVWQGVGRG